jgi:stage V sporulation protein G
MEITEVRIKLMEDSDDRLQGFCSITFDNCFVVRDLKIIEGTSGPFVAMPSRKLTTHCHHCGSKNHLKANYCNQCGARQREAPTIRDAEGRAKLYADIAHPINSTCRDMIQRRVIAEYRSELERSQQPGYVSRYDDAYEDDVDAADLLPESERKPQAPPLPKGTHIEPAESEVPPPHIAPSPQPGKSAGPAGSGEAGPRAAGNATAISQAGGSPPRDVDATRPAGNRGEFGAGIF